MSAELRKKYRFSDFTEDHYRKLLIAAKSRFSFARYHDFNPNSNFLLWRHDIDYSVHRALALARIEAEEGVASTHFILLHSEYYHFFEKNCANAIRAIKSLGHDIGLHFDSHFYGIEDPRHLVEKIEWERQILERVIDSPVHAFSFHNTSPFTMSCQDWKYGGLINAYANFFQTKVTYCSDSLGYWRHSPILDILQSTNTRCAQILTHPEWWQQEAMAPRQRILRCINGRANASKSFFDNLYKECGFLNIDEERIV
jgi:hypothetical protein